MYVQDLGQYQQDLGGLFDVVKKIGGGALDIVTSHGEAKGRAEAAMELARAQQAAARPAGGTPKWLLPVGIGAGALVLILMLKKKG